MFIICRDRIEVAALDRIIRPGDGGVVRFVGIVRGPAAAGASVTRLTYEAFEPMASREFAAIAGEARERFGDVAIAIVHRIGDVPVGETSVAVVAAGQHRAAAFGACRYTIDEVKRRAPIWKKEHYADGTSEWRANVSP